LDDDFAFAMEAVEYISSNLPVLLAYSSTQGLYSKLSMTLIRCPKRQDTVKMHVLHPWHGMASSLYRYLPQYSRRWYDCACMRLYHADDHPFAQKRE